MKERKKRAAFFLAVLAAAVALAISGCAKRQAVKPSPEQQTAAPASEPAAPPQEPASQASLQSSTVYFDFDSYAIRDDQKPILQDVAKAIREGRDIKLMLEGHCDERGTVEYNLALGDRRARAVKSYLQGLGADPDMLETVSFGEERPAASGHDEASWARNRRVEVVPGQ